MARLSVSARRWNTEETPCRVGQQLAFGGNRPHLWPIAGEHRFTVRAAPRYGHEAKVSGAALGRLTGVPGHRNAPGFDSDAASVPSANLLPCAGRRIPLTLHTPPSRMPGGAWSSFVCARTRKGAVPSSSADQSSMTVSRDSPVGPAIGLAREYRFNAASTLDD
jgi:hypothetical protein